MLQKGIHSVDPNKKLTIIKKESDAITHAIEHAATGSLVVICSDVVPDALEQVQRYKEVESGKLYKM